MEILKKLFSPRYRELVRLSEERRIRNMVRGKDLSKPVHVITKRWKYLAVNVVAQDGKNLEIKGREGGSFVYRSTAHVDKTTGIVHPDMRAFIIGSTSKKVPFSSVVRIS
ncbi:MAG: hypothetical protein AAB573_02665 [Patescibacteria group bacterium]